jgi:hypothetical protein
MGRVKVYVIRSMGPGGELTIGQSQSPEACLEDLQAAHAYELRLLGTAPARDYPELWVQAELMDYRLQGGWIRPEPEVLEFLEALVESRVIPPSADELRGLEEPWNCPRRKETRDQREKREAQERRNKRMAWRKKHMRLEPPSLPPKVRTTPERARDIVVRALWKTQLRALKYTDHAVPQEA